MSAPLPLYEVPRERSPMELVTSFDLPNSEHMLVLPSQEDILRDPAGARDQLTEIEHRYDELVVASEGVRGNSRLTLLDARGVQSLRTNPAIAPAVFLQAQSDPTWLPTNGQDTRQWSETHVERLFAVIRDDEAPFIAEAMKRHPWKTIKSALHNSLSSLHSAVTQHAAPGQEQDALREAAFVQTHSSLKAFLQNSRLNHEAPIPRRPVDKEVVPGNEEVQRSEPITVEELITPGKGRPARHNRLSALGKLARNVKDGWDTFGAVTASKIYGSHAAIIKNDYEHRHGKRLNATTAILAGVLVLKSVAAARGIEHAAFDLPDMNVSMGMFGDDTQVKTKPAHTPAPEHLPEAERVPMENDSAAEKFAAKREGIPTPTEANEGRSPVLAMPEYKTAGDSMWNTAIDQFEEDFVEAGGDKGTLTQHDLDVAAGRITDAWATQNRLPDPDNYFAGQDYRMEDFYTASQRAAHDQIILGLLDNKKSS